MVLLKTIKLLTIIILLYIYESVIHLFSFDLLSHGLIIVSAISILYSSLSQNIKESLFYGVISLFSYLMYAKFSDFPEVYLYIYYISVALGVLSYSLSLIDQRISKLIRKPLIIASFPLTGIILSIYGLDFVGIISATIYLLFILGKLQDDILTMKYIFIAAMPLVIFLDLYLGSIGLILIDILNFIILIFSVIQINKLKKDKKKIHIQWQLSEY